MRRFRLCSLWIALFFCSRQALALEVNQLTFLGKKYTAAKVNLKQDDLRLFWKKEDTAYKFFDALSLDLKKNGTELLFAMNAGMYMEDHSPLGLYIENSALKRNLNLKNGYGNFYLKPNGVFLVDQNNQPMIQDSTLFQQNESKPKWATQSGPLLLQNGRIHSAFQEKSKNILIRNGVGVDENQNIYLVISNDPVNFYEFAQFFQEQLKCKNALYLDGSVSQIHSTHLQRFDKDVALGPMIGVIKKTTP